jgi:hypothetical protein
MQRLERGLVEAQVAAQAPAAAELLVRLRNYLLVLANQSGDAELVGRLLADQREAMPRLVQLPEGFRLMLDYRPLEIEAALNDLEFARARDLAVRYHELMARYAECWDFVQPGIESDSLWASDDFVRASSTLWRMETYYRAAAGEDLQETIEGLRTLCQKTQLRSHRSRNRNYLTLALLKAGAFGDALDLSLETLERSVSPSVRDQHVALRAAADAVLAGDDELRPAPIAVLERAAADQPDGAQHGHPVDLIWRDAAIPSNELGGDRAVAHDALRAVR